MTEPMLSNREVLETISVATYLFLRLHLPRRPLSPGIIEVLGTYWVATYRDAAMQPHQFARWECLNPIDGILCTLGDDVWYKERV